MKDRLDFALVVGSAANGTTIRDAVLSNLSGKAVFQTDLPVRVVVDDDDGLIKVVGDYRLQLLAVAKNLYDSLVARWTSGALADRILVGSRCRRHLCYHDEKPWRACVVVAETTK